MKSIIVLIITLITSQVTLAQDVFKVPDWFSNPNKGEYVGVSIPYENAETSKKSAEYSALLSYILSLKKEFVKSSPSEIPKFNTEFDQYYADFEVVKTDTTILYNLLSDNGRKVGDMKVMLTNTHRSDLIFDNKKFSDTYAICKEARITFNLTEGYSVIRNEKNREGSYWVSIKPNTNTCVTPISGNFFFLRNMARSQGTMEQRGLSFNRTYSLGKITKDKSTVIIDIIENEDSTTLKQTLDTENFNVDYINQYQASKTFLSSMAKDLSRIGYNNGINGVCPLYYPYGAGYVVSLMNIFTDFALSDEKFPYEGGLNNVGNFFQDGYAQSYYMPTTNRNALYAVKSDNERPNNNSFVVIIGNEDYQMVESVPYAKNDARAFEEYCQLKLNIPSNQIMLYENATYGKMKMALKHLKDLAKAYKGGLKVIFYYAGHGIPDEQTHQSYLLPIDTDGTMVEVCYKLNDLYNDLALLNAKQVVVMMDACFSGANRTGGMLQSARGVAIKAKEGELKGNMVVLSAASGEQTAYPYQAKEHGLFTYYLLNKLEQDNGNTTLGELAKYIITEVGKTSVIENKKLQTPTVGYSSTLQNKWESLKLKE